MTIVASLLIIAALLLVVAAQPDDQRTIKLLVPGAIFVGLFGGALVFATML